MDNITHIILASKLIDVCSANNRASFYACVPSIDKKPEYFRGIYAHTLENQPNILGSAFEIFNGKRMEVARNSYEYKRIKEERESFINILGLSQNFLKTKKIGKIPSNEIEAALSLISHIYFDTFTNPVHFFLPHSPICSGQWNFWESIDYIKLREKLNKKEILFSFREEIIKNNVWDIKMGPNDFPLIIKRRLLKEHKFDEPLSSESMIKAMIIRLGEMGKPFINYEVIDFSIRSFFSYLGINKYVRVDRETEFLRRLELKIAEILKKLVK